MLARSSILALDYLSCKRVTTDILNPHNTIRTPENVFANSSAITKPVRGPSCRQRRTRIHAITRPNRSQSPKCAKVHRTSHPTRQSHRQSKRPPPRPRSEEHTSELQSPMY